MKKLATGFVALLAIALAVFFFVIPTWVDRKHNYVYPGSPTASVQPNGDQRSRPLAVDMHADTLLWNRDLNERATVGHVDIPRLIEGGIALQGFSVVTKTPRGLNIDRNPADSDNITLLAIAQRWPPATWSSLTARALYQATRLHDFARESNRKLSIIRTRADLSAYLERRRGDPSITAGWLALEGAHALEGRIENLDVLFDAGFRVIAPTHFFDSELAGSASGVGAGGLTALGTQWVKRMEAKRMIVDLAHASPRTIDDILALATRPVIVSHTGVKGTCDNNRNLSDDQIQRIARNGGLIGVGFWKFATCGEDVASIVRAVRYTGKLAGYDRVALGSDWDGYVPSPIDASQIGQLAEALRRSGLTEEELAKVMGGNVIRLFSQLLP
jgi:membrane dipeptidase